MLNIFMWSNVSNSYSSYRSDIKDIYDVAKSLGLFKKDFIWILSKSVGDYIHLSQRFRDLRPGILGIVSS